MIQKILLVDDEFEITDINMRYLVNAGYEVGPRIKSVQVK